MKAVEKKIIAILDKINRFLKAGVDEAILAPDDVLVLKTHASSYIAVLNSRSLRVSGKLLGFHGDVNVYTWDDRTLASAGA